MDNRRETVILLTAILHSFGMPESLPPIIEQAAQDPALSNTQAHHLRAVAAALRQPSPVEAIKKAL
jgi:hypothetical protein